MNPRDKYFVGRMDGGCHWINNETDRPSKPNISFSERMMHKILQMVADGSITPKAGAELLKTAMLIDSK